MPQGRTYTNKQVAEIVGLSPRTIQYYTRECVVGAFLGGGKRGSHYLYDNRNLLEYGIIKELRIHYVGLGRILNYLIDAMRQFDSATNKEMCTARLGPEDAESFLTINVGKISQGIDRRSRECHQTS